ncbi:MAG: glycosyltransferase involved in cell wall biosynthesis [Verrucomicrobiales bacterium]|jgi:glycosyltransferase involved in cell wall biosynthesis
MVRALRDLGHEMTLVPLYLPMVTDDVHEDTFAPLFLGGINMYLQQKFRVFRWTPWWLDRFFNRESFLLGLVDKAGMTRARDLGEMTVSSLKGTHGEQRKEVQKLISWLKKQEKPDIISFSNGLLSGVAKSVHEELKIPVVCTLQGEDSFLDTLPEPYRRQSWDLFRENSNYISRYIGVSDYYSETMRNRLELTDKKVVTVHNGIDFSAFSADSGKRLSPPVIGYLARMCMGKGLHTLVDAFIDLRQRGTVNAKLHLAGAKTTIDGEFIDQQKRKLDDAGLLDDVEITPNLSSEAKLEFLQSLSVFSVPAMYGESFGLYLLEAMACEVPVVQPNHAAFPEILEKTGGGLLYDPEDPANLADSLEMMLSLEERRRKLGFEGGQRARKYFTAERMSTEIAAIYETVAKTAS